MKLKKLLTCLLYCGILALILGGCVNSAGDRSGFPTGRFVDEVGYRAFEFDEDGMWRYFEGNLEVPSVQGRYGTSGNYYTEMTHDAFGYQKIPVTYTWTYGGQKLTFQLYGEDVLSHRKTCYDGQTYVKSE